MPATPTFRTTTRHMLKESKTYASQTLMGGLSGFESPIGLDRRDRLSALKSGDIGFVHSWDINTSVDGPGTRMTVFMSGCPLRCQYCQNPDTWKMRDGKPVYLDAMIKKVDRYKDLFKATHGGITFSGGESMMQPAFVSRVFHAAKEMGVHTCLDTSGFLNTNYTDEMLEDIDLCLLDVKSGDEETYHKVTGGTLQPTIDFGQRLAKAGKKIWVRFVLVPGLTDSEENVENVAKICESFGDAVEHIDVLGFHRLHRVLNCRAEPRVNTTIRPVRPYPRDMADIYAFPTGESNDGRPVRPQGVPDEVWAAVESVSTMKRIHDVRYREIPVPSTLADYGIGVEFEAGERALGDAFSAGLGSDAESRIATGWIMMLYAHELRIDWDSNWRCVAFARLPLETAENDSLTPGMYWDDMCDYFDGIEPDSVSGTVTVTQNTAFGSMAGSTSAGCEIRVSWTPLDGTGPDGTMDAGAQVRSWAAFIRSTIRFEEDDAS